MGRRSRDDDIEHAMPLVTKVEIHEEFLKE
jgi:hypothetical protein